jgi:hypothetical protein
MLSRDAGMILTSGWGDVSGGWAASSRKRLLGGTFLSSLESSHLHISTVSLAAPFRQASGRQYVLILMTIVQLFIY